MKKILLLAVMCFGLVALGKAQSSCTISAEKVKGAEGAYVLSLSRLGQVELKSINEIKDYYAGPSATRVRIFDMVNVDEANQQVTVRVTPDPTGTNRMQEESVVALFNYFVNEEGKATTKK